MPSEPREPRGPQIPGQRHPDESGVGAMRPIGHTERSGGRHALISDAELARLQMEVSRTYAELRKLITNFRDHGNSRAVDRLLATAFEPSYNTHYGRLRAAYIALDRTTDVATLDASRTQLMDDIQKLRDPR